MSGVNFDISAQDRTGRAFQGVKNRMDGLKAKVGGLTGGFHGLKGAIVGAFGVAALKAVSAFVDRIQKMAIRLGVTTEALSEYSFVADLSGVSTENLMNGMKKLGINISNAEQGLQTQVRALEALNLSSRDLIDLPLDKQFEIVADRLSGVKSQADKLRIANDLLGRSGTELITVFQTSASSIAQMRARARELNGTLSGETADAIATMNDKWTEVVTAVRGVGIAILDFFAPTLTFLMSKIADVIAYVGDLAKGLRFARDAIAAASIRFQQFVGIIEDDVANDAVRELADGWRNVGSRTGDAVAVVAKLKDKYEELGNTSTGVASKIKKSAEDIQESTKGVLGNEVYGPEMPESFNRMRDEAEETAEDMKGVFKDAIGGITTEFKSLKDVAVNALNSINNAILNRATNALADQLFGKAGGGGGGGLLDFGGILNKVGDAFGGFFANGGTLQPGQWGIAGENGAEPIFAGSSPLHVVSNKAAGRAMNVTVNISTPDIHSFRRSQGQIAAALAESVQRGTRNL